MTRNTIHATQYTSEGKKKDVHIASSTKQLIHSLEFTHSTCNNAEYSTLTQKHTSDHYGTIQARESTALRHMHTRTHRHTVHTHVNCVSNSSSCSVGASFFLCEDVLQVDVDSQSFSLLNRCTVHTEPAHRTQILDY